MTGLRRLAASMVLSTVLGIETATLICVSFGLGPNWWIAGCLLLGPAWFLAVDWLIDCNLAAWKRLRGLPLTPVREGDSLTLLALLAMRSGPARLVDLVMILSPEPALPSWLRPQRRWDVTVVQARRVAELVSVASRLAQAGLLHRTKRGRRWDGMSLYEITGLGRDVAARNAEVLMAGLAEERA